MLKFSKSKNFQCNVKVLYSYFLLHCDNINIPENMQYYSDLVTENFYSLINTTKRIKGFTHNSELRKLLDYTFIFIDMDNLESITIKESDLNKSISDDINITHILVLFKTDNLHCNFYNTHYHFIGIYNKKGEISNLEFSNFDLVSFDLSDNFGDCHYDKDLISTYNIILTANPFSKYVKKTMSLVEKKINSVLTDKYILEDFTQSFENLPLSITYKGHLDIDECYKVHKDFDKFLQEMKNLDKKIRTELIKPLKENKFTPIDYI